MEYQHPEQGSYWSGMTARFMYGTIDTLLKEHVTPEFRASIEKEWGPNHPEIQWKHPEIVRSLAELTESYYFGNLGIAPLDDFKEVFVNCKDEPQKLGEYVTRLEGELGSRDTAYDKFSSLLTTMILRRDKLQIEVREINNLDDGDELVKKTALDAFSHVSMNFYIDVIRLRFERLRNQS